MAKELVLLSKRQFEDMSKELEKRNEDTPENIRNECFKNEKETSTQNTTGNDIGTQTGNGLVFHHEDTNNSDGPPGILAKRKRHSENESLIKKEEKRNIKGYNIDFFYFTNKRLNFKI